LGKIQAALEIMMARECMGQQYRLTDPASPETAHCSPDSISSETPRLFFPQVTCRFSALSGQIHVSDISL
jgi:hypothetical protein